MGVVAPVLSSTVGPAKWAAVVVLGVACGAGLTWAAVKGRTPEGVVTSAGARAQAPAPVQPAPAAPAPVTPVQNVAPLTQPTPAVSPAPVSPVSNEPAPAPVR